MNKPKTRWMLTGFLLCLVMVGVTAGICFWAYRPDPKCVESCMAYDRSLRFHLNEWEWPKPGSREYCEKECSKRR